MHRFYSSELIIYHPFKIVRIIIYSLSTSCSCKVVAIFRPFFKKYIFDSLLSAFSVHSHFFPLIPIFFHLFSLPKIKTTSFYFFHSFSLFPTLSHTLSFLSILWYQQYLFLSLYFIPFHSVLFLSSLTNKKNHSFPLNFISFHFVLFLPIPHQLISKSILSHSSHASLFKVSGQIC